MTKNLTNDIPVKQVHPESVALLRARYRSYRNAKLVLGGFVLVTILLPIVSVFFAPAHPQAKEYLALIGLILLLVDVGILDHLQKDWIRRGAKLQEEFDVRVLGLPWKRFVAGPMVEPEDILASSAKLLSKKRESHLTPWYEPCVGEVPLHFGRLICQRTNIAYDERLIDPARITLEIELVTLIS